MKNLLGLIIATALSFLKNKSTALMSPGVGVFLNLKDGMYILKRRCKKPDMDLNTSEIAFLGSFPQ